MKFKYPILAAGAFVALLSTSAVSFACPNGAVQSSACAQETVLVPGRPMDRPIKPHGGQASGQDAIYTPDPHWGPAADPSS